MKTPRTARLRLQLLDLPIELRSNDAAILRDIAHALGAVSRLDLVADEAPAGQLALEIATASDRFEVVTTRGSLVGLDLPNLDAPPAVVTAVVLWAATHSKRFRVIHAGAVALGELGVLMPAPTHHGKSTFTAALVQRGFALVSDEIGAIDVDTLQLHPFPREMMLRPGSLEVLGVQPDVGLPWDQGRRRLVTAGNLSGMRRTVPTDLRLVVFLHFQRGAVLRTRRFEARDAFGWLQRLTPAQPQTGVRGFDVGVRLASQVPCWEMLYSDLEPAIARLRELLATVGPDGTSVGPGAS